MRSARRASAAPRRPGEQAGVIMRGKSLVRGATVAAVLAAAVAAGCGNNDTPAGPAGKGRRKKGAAPMSIELTSSAFEHGRPIPRRYTADGEDVSPPLAWSGLPDGAASLVLICEDPDAPAGVWDHWVVYNIPADVSEVAEGVSAFKAGKTADWTEGKTSWGHVGWQGPAPPSGTHRYVFRLHALDAAPDLRGGLTKAEVLKAVEGHVLASGELMGTYRR
jgi:hypothetical protein